MRHQKTSPNPRKKTPAKQELAMVARTIYGLEEVLAGELAEIGAKNIQLLRRAVSFTGDKAVLYKANFLLRTALRILLPIREFVVTNERELYQGIQRIDWTSYLHLKQTFAVDSTVNSQFFNHSKYVALKTKDAIVDQFWDKFGRRPSVDIKWPDLRFHIHIRENKCTVSLDSSGYSLHKRNYRNANHPAPINEVLAAGMLMLAGWKGQTNLIDPMCGSGTILSEAALIAQNIPPGILRNYKYSFMNWKDFDKALWKSIREEANAKKKTFEYKLLGYDKSAIAIREAKDQLFQPEFYPIRFAKSSFEDLNSPVKEGILVMNPPYGERMEDDEGIATLYKAMGDKFKHEFKGFDAWLITSNLEALKSVGLKMAKRYTLFNGPLECRFVQYPLY